MSPEFKELRQTIYTTEEEFHRLRQVRIIKPNGFNQNENLKFTVALLLLQIVVNIVLATDIMDKELGAQRKARWEKAFNSTDDNASKGKIDFNVDDDKEEEEKEQRDVNRKATIVLEHLIQVWQMVK